MKRGAETNSASFVCDSQWDFGLFLFSFYKVEKQIIMISSVINSVIIYYWLCRTVKQKKVRRTGDEQLTWSSNIHSANIF